MRAKHLIPFAAFDDVPESSPTDNPNDKQEKPFLWCPYNQHEKAFRSPWTNFYYSVETNNGVEDIRIYERECPPEEQDIRDLEGAANEVWEAYVHLYYGKDAIGSVYLKPTSNGSNGGNGASGGSSCSSFEGFFGVRKADGTGNGSWDSVHLAKVEEPNQKDKACEYHVESAVSISLGLDKTHKSDISASLTKETHKTCQVRYNSHGHLSVASHLENLGKIMEDVEIDFRSKLERVHLPSTMEVIPSMYRKQHVSGTVHLMGGGDGHGHGQASGMGVGAGMIGEIASKAKAKASAMGGGGANPFMEAMKANLAKRAQTPNDADGRGDQYNDLKSGLKTHPSNSKTPMPSPMLDMKKTLKKTAITTKKPPPMELAPTPEFMDFRNKLKKGGIKP